MYQAKAGVSSFVQGGPGRLAKAGTRRHAPSGPGGVHLRLAHLALDEKHVDIAFGMVLQYDTYLRPSECLELGHERLGFPVGGRYNKWSIVVAPFQLGSATKTGKFDDSVLVADKPDRTWLTKAMDFYVQRHPNRLFPGLTLAKYEAWFRQATGKLRYRTRCVMPYILRHSGASNDAFHKRRSLLDIQKRGRWEAKKSVSRYE